LISFRYWSGLLSIMQVKCQAMAAIVYYCCHLTASWCLVDILHTFLHNISLTREKKMKLKAKYYMLIGWGKLRFMLIGWGNLLHMLIGWDKFRIVWVMG